MSTPFNTLEDQLNALRPARLSAKTRQSILHEMHRPVAGHGWAFWQFAHRTGFQVALAGALSLALLVGWPWLRWRVVNAWVSLGADLESTTLARRFAEETMTGWSIDADRYETARLLVSELVANAVTHAETDVTLQLDFSDERLRVEVRDQADGQPQLVRRRQPAIGLQF